MPFTKLSALTAIACLFSQARAAEHGAAPAPAGEHGAAPVAVPREHKEFVDKTVKLGALATKLEESEKTFAHLVHEKQEAATPEAKLPILKEMVEIAKQRNLDVIEYNKVKSDLALRYPNQGEHLNRHFRNHQSHSVEDLEHAVTAGLTLDDLLSETKQMIDQKYAPFNPAPKVSPRAPASTPAGPHGTEGPRLRLER